MSTLWARHLWQWLTAAREEAEIAALTPRELRDIGIDRASMRRR